MNLTALRDEIDLLASSEVLTDRRRARVAVGQLLDALEAGSVRAAEPGAAGWRVQAWVKRGILLAFRVGEDVAIELPPGLYFRDRDTLPPWNPNTTDRKVRVVPGGSAVRRGAHLAEGVVVMPPAYVNVGAWVGSGTMIDSHALVGSCAQIGSRVHLSAAVQVGGVLEPVGSLPVIIEDEAFVGGGCGLYEGTHVGARAVLGAGVVLTRSVPLIDLVRQTVHRAGENGRLAVPADAVVVPGSRPAAGKFAVQHGVQLQTPVIVRYRSPGDDVALALEEALR